MNRHSAAVSKIAASVRAFYERGEPYRVYKGSSNTTRRLAAGPGTGVDIRALDNVLSVDAARRTALVEPNVPMDRLVEATLPHGLVPPVVMEFPGITAGGGFAGTGGESSSFRHGYFDETVRRVEMVLADGEVVEAENPARGAGGERAELFRGAGGAVGTLGLTTLLELELVEAKKYVRTTYRRTRSVAEAVEAVKREVGRADNDYVDGILFSRDHGAVITGQLTDDKPDGVAPQTFSGAWDPWYYMHVQSRTAGGGGGGGGDGSSSNDTVTEYIPLAEYLFRYDRGGFWVGRAAFRYFQPWVPFTRLTRWFLDDFLHTRMLYRALHASGEGRMIVQDLALPFATAERFVDYTARELGIWPLWLCPLRRRDTGPTFHPVTRKDTADPVDETQMLNIGVWGEGPRKQSESVAKNRALEAKLRELGGMKWLYARTYYDEAEFWDVYGGRAWYDELRAKFRATTLPTVYDKVKVKEEKDLGLWDRLKLRRPIGGLYGIYKGIQSKDYMLHRNATWKWKGEQEPKA